MSETPSSEIQSLDQIPMGRLVEVVEVVEVAHVEGALEDDPIARRLGDLGVRKGARIEVLRRAPLGDPTVFELCDYQLCLRRSESARVRVRPIEKPDRP